MSRLRELMEELCPNGVEYRKLGEILSRHKGMAITAGKMKELHIPNGEIRIFAAGNTFADVSESDIDKAAVIREPGIIVKSHGNIGFEYYTKPFSHKNEMWSYTCGDNATSLKYVYYMLEKNATYFQNKAKTGKLPQISIVDTENYEIPVPPLEIQNEIVKLLDNFTDLTADLTAELALRKKQYNFYRDSLLNFVRVDDTIVQTDRQTDRQVQRISKFGLWRKDFDVEWKTLGEVCTLVSGGDVPKEAFSQYFTEVYNIPIYSNGVGGKDLYGFTNVPRITQPCVTIAARGTIGYSALRMEPFYPVIRLICAIPCEVVDVKYLFYILQMTAFKTPRTGIPQLTIPMVRCYSIPVPSLEIQQKIVSILDRFDTLCNDLISGLPAEIAARKKQYEHYRDRLLTFPRSKLEERS